MQTIKNTKNSKTRNYTKQADRQMDRQATTKRNYQSLGMYRISGYGWSVIRLFFRSGSGPVVPRNRISEPDNSTQMWPRNLTKLLVCSGLKPFLA